MTSDFQSISLLFNFFYFCKANFISPLSAKSPFHLRVREPSVPKVAVASLV